MATAIGTNTMTSLVRQFIWDEVTDNIYKSNPLLFRAYSSRKKMVQGGTQIEVPLDKAMMAAGGPYSGYETLDITPSDTVVNGAWDWRQYYVPVSFSGLDLLKADSPLAVANLVTFGFHKAEMQLADWLGIGLWSDGSNTKHIDGLKGAIDNGSVLATYGGLGSRTTTNAFWGSQVDTATTTLTLLALQTLFQNCTEGGRHPTVIMSTAANYTRFWNLNQAVQAFPVQPQGHDEQLAQPGFTNLLLNTVPWIVDSHIPANHIFMINEDYFWLVVSPRGDFYMEDWIIPLTQDAISAKLIWYGQAIFQNVQRQGKMTAVTA